MKKPTAFLLISLLISALKNISVPDKYDVFFGIPGHLQTVNNFIYFFGTDLYLFFLSLTILHLSKKKTAFYVIAKGAFFLAVGKIIDEFTSSYGWGDYEKVYDIFIIICSIIALLRLKSK